MVAGNTCTVASKASCDEAYEAVRNHQSLGRSTTFLTYPSARKYAERLCRESPEAKRVVQKRLAVVTGVSKGTPGYHVAEELGITAEMDVVLMGHSAKQLQLAAESIEQEADARGLHRPELYRVRIDRNSLRSVASAAEEVEQVCLDYYGGRLHVLVNFGDDPTDIYGTSEEGVEVNVGRSYLAPRLLADLLLPVLRAAATDDHKPRIVQEASIGHCQGSDFDPDLLRKLPQQGGAPDACFASLDTDVDLEFEDDSTHSSSSCSSSGSTCSTGLSMYYRSKMALIADTIALSKEEPMLAVVTIHSGVINCESSSRRSRVSTYFSSLSPGQGARAALRAALDPSLNTEESMQGAYLHCDGNPWTVSDPTTINPLTGKVYDLEEYADKVRAVGDELCAKLCVNKSWERELENFRSTSCSSLLQSSQMSLLQASYSSILSQ